MLQKLWQRLVERQSRQEKERDDAAVERALEEQRRGHPDGMKESDQFPPVFKNTDWTGGGP